MTLPIPNAPARIARGHLHSVSPPPQTDLDLLERRSCYRIACRLGGFPDRTGDPPDRLLDELERNLAPLSGATRSAYLDELRRKWPDVITAALAEDPRGGPPEAWRPVTWKALSEKIGIAQWEWADWLPQSGITLLLANPKVGKSLIALYLAAIYLQGGTWPDGTPYTGPTGAVLWLEAEKFGPNFKRAEEWGLPLDRLYHPLDKTQKVRIDDPAHREAIERHARLPEVRLIVLDALRASHGRDENSSAIIGDLGWLASLSEELRKPVLVIHHTRKRHRLDTSEMTQDSCRGSSAIVAAATVVLGLERLEHTQERRLLVLSSNLGLEPEPIGMTITSDGLQFRRPAPDRERPRQKGEREKGMDFLREALRQGKRLRLELESEAVKQGLSWRTVRRAREELEVIASHEAQENGSMHWVWYLPADETDGCA